MSSLSAISILTRISQTGKLSFFLRNSFSLKLIPKIWYRLCSKAITWWSWHSVLTCSHSWMGVWMGNQLMKYDQVAWKINNRLMDFTKTKEIRFQVILKLSFCTDTLMQFRKLQSLWRDKSLLLWNLLWMTTPQFICLPKLKDFSWHCGCKMWFSKI